MRQEKDSLITEGKNNNNKKNHSDTKAITHHSPKQTDDGWVPKQQLP